MNESYTLSGKQLILCFSLITLLCLGFYTMGIYIGRLSTSQAETRSSHRAAVVAPAIPTTIKEATPQQSEASKYSVQIATTATRQEAEEIVAKLQASGFDSVRIIEPDSTANFYTVRVGPFKLDIAEQVTKELQQDLGFQHAQILGR